MNKVEKEIQQQLLLMAKGSAVNFGVPERFLHLLEAQVKEFTRTHGVRFEFVHVDPDKALLYAGIGAVAGYVIGHAATGSYKGGLVGGVVGAGVGYAVAHLKVHVYRKDGNVFLTNRRFS